MRYSSHIKPMALALLLASILSGCEKSPPPAEPPSARPLQTNAPVAEPRRVAPRIQIRDGRLFVDGERFFVRGIGYEPGAVPGRFPQHRKFEPEMVKRDLTRIKEAGFNTVRSWDGYLDAELELMERDGLWAIQGIYVNWRDDLSSPTTLDKAIRQIDRVVKAGAGRKNVLMYLVMNEPDADTIFKAGEPQFIEFQRRIRDRVHELDPGVPVSFSNTCVGEFLDPSLWNVLAFNLYMYAPVTVRDILGYRGYLEWIKNRSPPGTPLIVTEFGLSVSPTGEGRFGYGGNSTSDQVEGNRWMLENLLEAGAQGFCVFSYSDGWWKNWDSPKDAETHDDQAEEWYGLVEYRSKEDFAGTPRPAFESFRQANQAIWLQPVSWQEYRDTIPVEVYSTSDVTELAAESASGTRVDLKKEGHWWRGNIPATGMGATNVISLIGRASTIELPRQERTIVTNWAAVPTEVRPIEFALESLPQQIKPGMPIPVIIRASSPQGGKVADRGFKIGYYPHDGWDPGKSFDVRSDANGLIKLDLDALPNPGAITLSVSTGHEALQKGPTWGNAFILRVQP